MTSMPTLTNITTKQMPNITHITHIHIIQKKGQTQHK